MYIHDENGTWIENAWNVISYWMKVCMHSDLKFVWKAISISM